MFLYYKLRTTQARHEVQYPRSLMSRWSGKLAEDGRRYYGVVPYLGAKTILPVKVLTVVPYDA